MTAALRAFVPLLFAVALLVPTPAAAIDPVPSSRPVYGTIVVLKDRRAGFFEDVRKISKEVTWVRDGAERPAVPGLVLHEGDAIRTAAGSCVVETPEGWRIEIGEGSQVRLGKTVLQRLGEVFYKVRGAFTVEVDDVQLLVEGTAFKVDRDLPGNGEVTMTEGNLRLKGGDAEERVVAGHALTFSQSGPADLRSLKGEDIAALEAWRAERFEPSVVAGLRRNRVLVRAGGGVAWLDGLNSWGGGFVEGRVRAYGALWLVGGVGVLARPVDESGAANTAVVLPIHVGARLFADLPASLFIGGGIDFELMLGSRCADQLNCGRIFAANPGGVLAATVGMLLSRRVGFDLEFRGGLLRRVLPPVDPSLPATGVVDPRFDLAVGFFVRL